MLLIGPLFRSHISVLKTLKHFSAPHQQWFRLYYKSIQHIFYSLADSGRFSRGKILKSMCLRTCVRAHVSMSTFQQERATVRSLCRCVGERCFHLNRNALCCRDKCRTFQNTHFPGLAGMTKRYLFCASRAPLWHFNTHWKLICGDYTWELKIISYLRLYVNGCGLFRRISRAMIRQVWFFPVQRNKLCNLSWKL